MPAVANARISASSVSRRPAGEGLDVQGDAEPGALARARDTTGSRAASDGSGPHHETITV